MFGSGRAEAVAWSGESGPVSLACWFLVRWSVDVIRRCPCGGSSVPRDSELPPGGGGTAEQRASRAAPAADAQPNGASLMGPELLMKQGAAPDGQSNRRTPVLEKAKWRGFSWDWLGKSPSCLLF